MENAVNGLKTVQNLALSYLRSPYFFGAIAGSAAIILAAVVLASGKPYAAEWFEAVVLQAAGLLIAALFVPAAVFIAWNFFRSAQAVYREEMKAWSETQKQIGAGTPATLPETTDILLIFGPADAQDEGTVSQRKEDALDKVSNSKWALFLQYRNPAGVIFQPGGEHIVFSRATPPFQSDEWTDDQIICPRNTRFLHESPAEFHDYVFRFMEHYPEWAALAKLRQSGARAGSVALEIIRPSMNVLLFILFSLPVFAQNAAAVSEALGTRIREIPAKGDQVTYVFESRDYPRIGDGRKDYVSLLKSMPMYRDNGGGKFVAVVKNGEVVVRADQAGEVATAMRPNRSEGAPEPAGYSLPDSAGMADMAEQVKYEMWKAKEMAVDSAEPWWGVVMYAFWMLIPFLFLLGGASWLWAKVCATEGMFTVHKAARRIFAILSLSAATVLLANVMIAAIVAGVHPFLLFLLAIAECAIANRVVSWLIPDFRPAAGNHPLRNYHNNDQPPLLG